MTGRNEMRLNIATVQTAMQHWLKCVLLKDASGVVVTGVEWKERENNFVVSLDDKKEEPTP